MKGITKLYKRCFLLLIIMAISSPGKSQNPCHIGDSTTLVEFYLSTNGPNWTNNDNWLSGNVESWWGVTLAPDSIPTAAYRVVGLALVSNNLTGALSPLLCNLSELAYFSLYNNNLTGAIPSCMGQLTHFSVIDIAENQFTNPLPNFKDCPLTVLFIYNNNFSGALIDTLINHPLISLQIQHNKFSFLAKKDSFLLGGQTYDLGFNCLTFDDIIPYLIPTFFFTTYSPQDSVLQYLDTTVTAGSYINLESWIDTCQDNLYQWKKDGAFLTSNPVAYHYYYKPNIQFSDSGYYSCDITNPLAPDLTLHRREIHLRVVDTGTEINEAAKPENIELFYNLNSSVLNIRFNDARLGFIRCDLYDITGRKILRLFNGQATQQELVYNLKNSGIKKGTYFVKLELEGKLYSRKILIF